MSGIFLRSLCAGSAFSLIVFTGNAYSVDYRFTKIADTQGAFSSIENLPVINNLGQVAFFGADNSDVYGIYRWNTNGTITTIADTSMGFASFGLPALNNTGVVAFSATLSGGGGGVYKATGSETVLGDYEQVVGTGVSFSDFGFDVGINDAGDVAFVANNESVLYRTENGALTLVEDTSGIFRNVESPDINNNGTVVFMGNFDGNAGGGVALNKEGSTTVVADTVSEFSGFSGPLSINDNDIIAFRVSLDAGGFGIYLGDVNGIEEINTPSHSALDIPSINNLGRVAFTHDYGLYLNGDRLIGSGDQLFDKTVFGVGPLSGNALSDSNEIAFVVSDAHQGTLNLVLASPVPIPSAVWLFGSGILGLIGMARKKPA